MMNTNLKKMLTHCGTVSDLCRTLQEIYDIEIFICNVIDKNQKLITLTNSTELLNSMVENNNYHEISKNIFQNYSKKGLYLSQDPFLNSIQDSLPIKLNSNFLNY